MLKLLVLACAVTSVLADHHKVTCDSVTPLATVDFDKLTGNWIAVENLMFKDGYTFTPEDDKRPNLCFYAKASDATAHGMKIVIEKHEKDVEGTKTETVNLSAIADTQQGRLSLVSDVNDRTNWQFLVMDYKADKFMVYMLCKPPNEAGERLPHYAVIFSRHEDHSDHELISRDEELQIETHLGEMLHIDKSENKPVRLSSSCWASYAEPQ